MVGNETVGVKLRHRLSGSAARALTKAHGILMIIAWPILAAAAIYYPAYLKPVLSKRAEWFHVSIIYSDQPCSQALSIFQRVVHATDKFREASR